MFFINAKGITLDLNGHTITYADMDFTGVQNSGFEIGNPANPEIPEYWDLSGAHNNAWRQSSSQYLFFDNYSLRINNIAGDAYPEEYVLSSPVNLSLPGRYAITAEVQGGPYGVLDSRLAVEGIAATCSNTVSNMHLSYSGDMQWGLICEFDITQPATVRAKIIVGTKDPTKNTYLNIDEVDIRPIDDNRSPNKWGMSGIRAYGWNISMAEIKNGRIVEGRSKAIYSPAINTVNASKIHDLSIITNGINSENIKEVWGDGLEIYNNYLEANGKLPLNRQYPFSMINLEHTTGGNKIYNNTLVNGPHVGINHGNATGGVVNPYRSEIYGNIIKTKIIATNGFAVSLGSNVDFHDNIIQPIQGHGIGLSRDSDEVKIYNNLIEPRTWPCSEYSSYTYPNSVHGIRIKNYGSGAISNLEIFNNTIRGKTNPQLPSCYTEVVGITNYLMDDSAGVVSTNVKIHDNNISVETDNYLQQHAIAYKAMGQGEFYNNILKSNHIIVEMSDTDCGGATQYKKFYSNTLIKGDNPQGFYTLRYGYSSPGNNLFTDIKLQNNADLKDISFGINNSGISYSRPVDLTINWYLDINVKNQQDQAINGAFIEIKDKDNNLTDSLITDVNGNARSELKEYIFTYQNQSNKSYKYYSPYNIKIAKDGSDIFSQQVNVDKSMSLAVKPETSQLPDTTPPAPPANIRIF